MTGSASSHRRTIPHGRAARRLDWGLLPPILRTLIARRLGSPVVSAESAGAGYTPGFASVLTCANGTRHFVKAASKKAQRTFADAYREEARKLRALPPGLPVPRLLWSHEDDLWVVLELQYVDGAAPAPPWIDTVLLLISAHGNGLDAEALLAERPLTRRVDPDDIDSLLALIAGYFFARRDQPAPRQAGSAGGIGT